ncbi:hypothetical protein FA10DRAFT_260866 [Acaromyces ingoldii]|uniref:Inhibitor I9 domain-containing protein n=1 Tax=Acaromyces ingoldii TaxID=215250 RepID=A0A316YIB5_9BASI|nr:hypothetical protein FA10DRAFT_260866 [Acaromyces ingoldii]PWN88939.1 hypothetical protein FA10DRAFT_260866 [Acaromyces ingoldii]
MKTTYLISSIALCALISLCSAMNQPNQDTEQDATQLRRGYIPVGVSGVASPPKQRLTRSSTVFKRESARGSVRNWNCFYEVMSVLTASEVEAIITYEVHNLRVKTLEVPSSAAIEQGPSSSSARDSVKGHTDQLAGHFATLSATHHDKSFVTLFGGPLPTPYAHIATTETSPLLQLSASQD